MTVQMESAFQKRGNVVGNKKLSNCFPSPSRPMERMGPDPSGRELRLQRKSQREGDLNHLTLSLQTDPRSYRVGQKLP